MLSEGNRLSIPRPLRDTLDPMATRQIIRTWSTLLLLALALVAHAPTGIDGKWNFHMETEGGPRETQARFTTDGETVSGTWGDVPVKGTFKSPELNLSFPMTSTEGGISGTLKITGRLENGQLQGRWAFSEYEGTFTAKRQE